MPHHVTIPVAFADDLLTYEQIAVAANVHPATVSNWANHPRRALRLPIVNLGHRTKRVRRSDWNAYEHNRRTINGR